jgi:tryptophan synthase alpha subunit
MYFKKMGIRPTTRRSFSHAGATGFVPSRKMIRSYLKKVFSPGVGVESLSQVLDILEYACGLILGLALISNANPNFEMASS